MDWQAELRADAMFFDAACRECDRAKEATLQIQEAQRRITKASERMDAIQSHEAWESDEELYGEFESLAIAFESLATSQSAVFGPQLQSLASVHLLTAASLEAHINARGHARFSGREWDAFERCTLDGKWIFFPRLTGCAGFESGTEPLQGLHRLIRRRNELVHFKPRRESWQIAKVPIFLEKLGLSVEAGEDSVNTARRLIMALSEQLGEGPPAWLHVEGRLGYFDTRFGDGSSHLSKPIARNGG